MIAEDRERVQRKGLYSIDSPVPGDRYQVPVRIKVFARASSPSIGELDPTAWRPDQDVSDKPQIEQAAGRFVSELKVLRNPERDTSSYRTLIELAPDFFKEFTVTSGLTVERYRRKAVSRTGEPRTDRRNVALAGSLFTHGNIERFLRVVDYGLRQAGPRRRHSRCRPSCGTGGDIAPSRSQSSRIEADRAPGLVTVLAPRLSGRYSADGSGKLPVRLLPLADHCGELASTTAVGRAYWTSAGRSYWSRCRHQFTPAECR
jgi:hypothetical protein